LIFVNGRPWSVEGSMFGIACNSEADLRQVSIAELLAFSLLKLTPRYAGQGSGLLRALSVTLCRGEASFLKGRGL
jgi:hypothetical protein